MNASRSRPPSVLAMKRSVSKPIINTAKAPLERPRLGTTASLPCIGVSGNGKGKEGTEGNIEVVVRIRRSSAKETEEIQVAQSEATRGSSVTLIDPSTVITSSSALAPSTLTPNEKTYNFGGEKKDAAVEASSGGNVFGPEATQGMLFDDIVKPFLVEVLLGFNCTIFAYGQTGTGKTFTMEGNLGCLGGTFHEEAGIIPRSLYSLFKNLEQEGKEFSVKCSYVELYNEELRDLNSLELNDSAGSATNGGLKIFEDKTGVNISGLNETFITSAMEGLSVLTRGAQKRQIAATKCNEQSSRSHSIFTITLQIKEVSAKTGEEIIKIGKLNLVDLAGSENIGKSGAKEGRAKEAGMINVSLLALGRVINLLVQKSGHIPYRESKLTRLLQDSLGGKTKTCIIATISPHNFEESISTLDYAFRAKSIENKPELNSKMVKTGLLKEYTGQIESLKSDLLATREKNGIYFSTESWEKLTLESSTTTTSLSNLRIQHEILNSELSTKKEQFEQNLHLLGIRNVELERISLENANFKKREFEMIARIGELESIGVEERKRIADCEEKQRIAKEGERIAKEDVEGLLMKLQRKTIVENSNSKTIGLATLDLASRLSALQDIQEQLTGGQEGFLETVEKELSIFGASELAEIGNQEKIIKSRLVELLAFSSELLNSVMALDSQSVDFQTLIEETQAGVIELLRNTSAESRQNLGNRIKEVQAGLKGLEEIMRQSVLELSEPMRILVKDCQKLMTVDNASLLESQALERASFVEKTEELELQISTLKTALESQTTQSTNANAQLLTMLTNSINQQNLQNKLIETATLNTLSSSFTKIKEKDCKRITQRIENGEERLRRSEAVGKVLNIGRDDVETISSSSGLVFKSTLLKVTDNFDSISTSVEESSTELLDHIQVGEKDVKEGKLLFKEAHSDTLGSLDEMLGQLTESVETAYNSVQTGLQSAKSANSTHITALSSLISNHQINFSTQSNSINSAHKQLEESISLHLEEDISTGLTPKRRVVMNEEKLKEGGIKRTLTRTKVVLGERNL